MSNDNKFMFTETTPLLQNKRKKVIKKLEYADI